MKPLSIISVVLVAVIVIGVGIALLYRSNTIVTAQPTVLISPQQAINATGIKGFSIALWVQVNNFSQLINETETLGSQEEGNNMQFMAFEPLFSNLSVAYVEFLKHNDTTFIVGAVLRSNFTINFNKLESILVLFFNFNTSTYQTMNYAYGNISIYGVAVGYANKTIIVSFVNGTSNNVNSAVNVLKEEYNTLKRNNWNVPEIPSKLVSIPHMALAAWSYANFTALNVSYNRASEGIFHWHHIHFTFGRYMEYVAKVLKSLNVTTFYLGYYTNSTLNGYLAPIYAQNESAVNKTLTIVEFFAHNYTTGTYNGAEYLISHVFNNSFLYAVDGHYIIIEEFNAYVSNSFMLNVLGNELSALGL